MKKNHLKWYGHVLRKPSYVSGMRRDSGQPKKTLIKNYK